MSGREAGSISISARVAAGWLVVAALITVVFPAGCVLVGLGSHWESLATVKPWVPAWGLLGLTFAWALGIGVVATILAWPSAWALRGRGWGASLALLPVLAFPSYLSYAGYGLIRAPRTGVGDVIERLAQAGWTELPMLVSRGVAGLSMALWCWPLATIVLAAGLKAIPESVLDLLAMERLPKWRKVLLRMGMSRRALASSIGVCGVLMLGSAVPLHLAQVATYSVKIWFDLTMTPGGLEVWVASWPLVATALVLGGYLGGRLTEVEAGSEVVEAPRRAKWWTWGLPAGLGLGVPLVMCLLTVRGWKQFMLFWPLSGSAAAQSGGIAAGVGVLCAGVALGVFVALSGADAKAARVARWCVVVWLVAGLMPGVLVGKAFAEMGLRWEALGDSQAIVILAHAARFGAGAACLGCLAARGAAGVLGLRRMDGALSLLGWMETALPLGGAAVLWAGLLGAMQSLHEIESTIIVQPPGTPGLAQVMLGYLHYSRMEELSVGVVWIVGAIASLAGLGALGVRWLGWASAGESHRADVGR